MSTLISILAAVFAFFIIVLIHECGHFFVARWLNVKVHQFSIGFGKALYSRTAKSGVTYAIRLLPLGGYVQMADSNVNPPQDIPGSAGEPLDKKPLWARFLVVIAGPFVNIVLAILLIWFLYVIGLTQVKPVVGQVTPQSIAAKALLKPNDQIVSVGKWETHNWQQVLMTLLMHLGDQKPLPLVVTQPDDKQPEVKMLELNSWQFNPQQPALLQSLGITPKRPKVPPVIAQVITGSAAYHHLQAGDKILAINDKKIMNWYQFVQIIQNKPNQDVRITFQRSDKIQSATIKVGAHRVGQKKFGYLGVSPKIPQIPLDLRNNVKHSVLGAWRPAFMEIWRLTYFHYVILKQMIKGDISLKVLGGPISIFQSAGYASKAGIKPYLGFLALISLVIGVLNLLPIPGLDGGHLLFYLIELVTRKPPPPKIQYAITVLGFGFLIFVMVYATMNDLLRLLS